MDTLLQLLRDRDADAEIIALAERLAAGQVPEVEDDDADPSARLMRWPDGEGDEDAVEPLTSEELETLQNFLVGLAEDDDADYEILLAAAETNDVIRAEQAVRAEVADRDAEEREAARQRLTGGAPTAAEDGEDDDDAESDDDGGADDAGGDDDGATDDAGLETPVPVAARGRTVSRQDINRARQRRPEPTPERVVDPEPAGEVPQSEFVFAHDVPEFAGRSTTDLSDVDRALELRRGTWRGTGQRGGPREYLRVASMQGRYPEERRLIDSDGHALSSAQITRRIREVIEQGVQETRQQRNSLLAAGGLCTLPVPIYNVVTYGDQRRPIRDQALVSFQGPMRGSVTDLTPPTLPDLTSGVTVWTVSDDEAVDPETESTWKPCVRVDCGTQRTTQIHGVPLCLTVGNFLATTYSELQNAWSDLGMVSHARLSEATLFDNMVASTGVNSVNRVTTDVSAVRDLLVALDTAAAGMRSRHRLADDFPFVAVLPSTFLAVARSDIARQMPGGSTQENLTVAMAAINGWFASRAISPIWSPDINTMGDQADGAALVELPPTIDALIYPAGTFIHLDGGQLDLGVVRDTDSNRMNDFQIFFETFEAVHMVGPEATHLEVDVCPSGAVVGTVDPENFCPVPS